MQRAPGHGPASDRAPGPPNEGAEGRLDTLLKLFALAVTAPWWLAIVRSLHEQLRDVAALEPEPPARRRSSEARVAQVAPPPTWNDELVALRLQISERRAPRFRDATGFGPRAALRREIRMKEEPTPKTGS